MVRRRSRRRGQSAAHNMQPYLTLTFCIALQEYFRHAAKTEIVTSFAKLRLQQVPCDEFGRRCRLIQHSSWPITPETIPFWPACTEHARGGAGGHRLER